MNNTYDVVGEYINYKTRTVTEIRENDKIDILLAKEVDTESKKKFLKMKKERDEFEKMIEEFCGSFYFYFYEKIDKYDLKESIKLRFLYLSTYIAYTERNLYLTYDNGIQIDRDGLKDLLKLQDREFKTTIKALVDAGLLTKSGKRWIINADIAYKGTLSREQKKQPYTRIFKDALRELYSICDTKQHKQLYYIFKLLPYINPKYNVVCANPSEENPDDIIPLNMKQICELVGYNPNQSVRLKTDLYKTRLYGTRVIVGVENENGMWFKVNPRVFYKGRSRDMDQLNELLTVDFKMD